MADGTDVNAKSKRQSGTPLHAAASADRKEMVEFLIANGADVNAKMKDGRTPLDAAIEVDRPDLNDYETAILIGEHGGKMAEELKAEGK